MNQTPGCRAGLRTEYVLDVATPLTMVLGETSDPGSPEEASLYYLHGLDLVAQGDGTASEYFAYDGLGSVRQVLSDAGSPLLTQAYDPYGNVYASAGTAVSAFGFTGEQTDANGLLYLRARYYAPGMGRFFQTDPSRQEANPYVYGFGNPVNFTDPSGTLPCSAYGIYDRNYIAGLCGEQESAYQTSTSLVVPWELPPTEFVGLTQLLEVLAGTGTGVIQAVGPTSLACSFQWVTNEYMTQEILRSIEDPAYRSFGMGAYENFHTGNWQAELDRLAAIERAEAREGAQATTNSHISENQDTNGFKLFYSVASENRKDIWLANLQGGNQWPTEPERAEWGPGLYTWEQFQSAQAYGTIFVNRHGNTTKFFIVTFSISTNDYNSLRTLIIPPDNDALANQLIQQYSRLANPDLPVMPHDYDHIITGRHLGVEHYFTPNV